MVISQPIFRFLGVMFDGDHDFEGLRSPMAHLDTVLRNLLSHPRPPRTQTARATRKRFGPKRFTHYSTQPPLSLTPGPLILYVAPADSESDAAYIRVRAKAILEPLSSQAAAAARTARAHATVHAPRPTVENHRSRRPLGSSSVRRAPRTSRSPN